MYGNTKEKILNENSLFNPVSPYSVSKLFGFHISNVYRSAYNIFVCNGILFNHESPLRGESFVTKKIVTNLVRIKQNLQEFLEIGNLDAKRDWGYAKDYVEAMHLMLQEKKADDFVIATKTSHSVKDFINICAKKLNIKLIWKNNGLKETGINKINKKTIIKIDNKYFRETEVDDLIGDFAKAKRLLKWKPKYSFDKLVDDMINSELNG